MKADIDNTYIGLPGTGKTTTLLDVLAGEMYDGTPVGSIAASTFRRSMAAEFESRAQGVIEGGLPDEHWFGTTHSLCYRLLGYEDVVQAQDKAEVCDRLGVRCSESLSLAEKADMASSSQSGGKVGDLLFAARSWCLNTNRDPRTDWRKDESPLSINEKGDVRRSPTGFEEFNDEYEAYKGEKGLIDFDDMLLIVRDQGLVPPVEVLIEDEFQDKSPLQVDIFENWSQEIDRVYVAGDPYQAIYGFAGTDPKYMDEADEIADESTVLDTSYRFGPELWDFATSILRRVRYDVPEIDPSGESSVEKVSFRDYKSLVDRHADDGCLHLFRCNYMASKAAEALESAGVPFSSPRGVRWTPRLVRLYNGTVKLFSTAIASQDDVFDGPLRAQYDLSHITVEESLQLAKGLRSIHQSGMKKRNVKTLETALDAESNEGREDIEPRRIFGIKSLANAMDGYENPFRSGVFTKSGFGSENSKSRLETAYDQLDGETIGGINHRVMTMHAAKGTEAENVFLFNGVSRSIMDDKGPFPRTSEDEARVFFVGATRAERNLYVVNYPQEPRIKLPEV